MRPISANRLLGLVVALTVSNPLAGAAFGQTEETPKPEAPDGWVFAEEDAWLTVPDTTGRYFHKAAHDFTAKRYEEAASEIRKAAGFVMFAGRREPDTKAKETLMESVLDLEHLAANLEQRVAYSGSILRHSIARAQSALSNHYVLAARRAWQESPRNTVKIGHELRAAALHVESGMYWTGDDATEEGRDAVTRATTVAEALQNGHQRDGKEVQAAIGWVEQECERLGRIVAVYPRIPGRTHEFADTPALPVPQGYVLIEDSVWFVHNDEIGRLLHEARAAFVGRQYKRASTDIRQVAALVQMESTHTRYPVVQKALKSSIWALQQSANDIDTQKLNSATKFNSLFARTHQALAHKYQLDARDAWQKRLNEETARALRAAASHLENGLAWAGHEMAAEAIAGMKDLESACSELTHGSRWAEEDVTNAIEFAGKEIENLGKRI